MAKARSKVEKAQMKGEVHCAGDVFFLDITSIVSVQFTFSLQFSKIKAFDRVLDVSRKSAIVTE